LFHKTYGEYYVSGFVHGSSYWLQCEVDNSEDHSHTGVDLNASITLSIFASGNGGGAGSSYSNTSNAAKMYSNVIRRLSGHNLEKLSNGAIDISRGA
jgi:hypothetical protein